MKSVAEAARSAIGSTVRVQGWVKTVRVQKQAAFVELTDGSMHGGIQIVAAPADVVGMSTGCSVVCEGELVANTRGKTSWQMVEIQNKKLELLGRVNQEVYPLQKKHHSVEFLRENIHLRPRSNTFSAVTRIRNIASMAVHNFFQAREFLWIHTPVITSSDCEGAGEQFRLTTAMNDEKPPREFFGSPAYLTVSGQLEAEMFACSMSRAYTFGPTFRAENSNTSRHLAEFWMVEPEVAFADLSSNMDLAEACLKSITSDILSKCEEDMKFLDPHHMNRLESTLKKQFARISYTKAIDILQKSRKNFVHPVQWGLPLQSEHERYLAESHVGHPVFVTDYPKDIKPFYMRVNDDERTVAAVDLLVPRIGELIGGSQREERYERLLQRMQEAKVDTTHLNWYLDLRRFGTVPHAGFGMGFERMLQYVTGIENIRDVIPVPRHVGRCDF
eukprot:GILK01006081.1.p1 GENE.GILK01006081.1~~GILK01006081.1.p1  ORF type:complete len:445 (+),score=66.23 GILK01006081.1:66-1400(+)